MPTPQQNAVTSAQNLVAIGNQILTIGIRVQSWLTDYDQNNWGTYWAAMATVPVNSDGSVAATNDVTPNPANPINVPTAGPLLVSANALKSLQEVVATLSAALLQTGGNIALPTPAIVQTLVQTSPNTVS